MNKILILLILLKPVLSISQIKFDDNVSIEFPGKIEKFDTIADGVSIKTFYHNTAEDSYAAIRTELDNLEYPSSETELKKYYRTLSKTYIEKFHQKGLILKDSSFVNINKLLFMKLILKDNDSENQNGESLILFADKTLYVFVYSKVLKYNERNKSTFLQSISFNKDLKQIEENFKLLSLSIKLGLLILFLLLIRIYKIRNKASS
ncbi:hypothetical protein G4D82_14050 [Flavobacterium sp. CYK-4]|nr:hypothetical protein [Flavobacterium lotistagni]